MHARLSPVELSSYLQGKQIAHAVVGALAVVARGHIRTTADVDVMTTDKVVLQPAFWDLLRESGASVDVRVGDYDDPLAGVVHLELIDGTEADVVVGRYKWQRAVIERAEPLEISGSLVPVVRTPDLILLKLFAGGPIDISDIHALLGMPEHDSIVAEVDSLIEPLPDDARELWASIRGHELA